MQTKRGQSIQNLRWNTFAEQSPTLFFLYLIKNNEGGWYVCVEEYEKLENHRKPP